MHLSCHPLVVTGRSFDCSPCLWPLVMLQAAWKGQVDAWFQRQAEGRKEKLREKAPGATIARQGSLNPTAV